MYAVIKAGGHQYRVKTGDTLVVDKVTGKVGESITFDKVLMLGGDKVNVGKPFVAGASVKATIKDQTRAPKVIVFKYKRRKNYKRTGSQKQPQTVIEINDINA